MTAEPAPRMRPFFPTVQDFAGATAPHFEFLVSEFGFVGPSIEEQNDEMYDVAYYGDATAVLLNWDTTGSFFACNMAPRLSDGSLDPITNTGSQSTRSWPPAVRPIVGSPRPIWMTLTRLATPR